MGAHSDYRNGLLVRFADREALSKDQLFERYWQGSGLDRKEVFELFNLIEEAYEIPAGLIRPEDHIGKLTDRVSEKRWWRSPFHDVIAGDRQFWLQEEFERKLEKYRLSRKVSKVDTIHELVMIWCGHLPQEAPPHKMRLERTRHERASLLSCMGEPLKRNVILLTFHPRILLRSEKHTIAIGRR